MPSERLAEMHTRAQNFAEKDTDYPLTTVVFYGII